MDTPNSIKMMCYVERWCCWCGEKIPAGETADYWGRIGSHGLPDTWWMHEECCAAYQRAPHTAAKGGHRFASMKRGSAVRKSKRTRFRDDIARYNEPYDPGTEDPRGCHDCPQCVHRLGESAAESGVKRR